MALTDKERYRVIDDVNSYYRLSSESRNELLLNKYPNAAAAYSLRLLDGYYRGPLVRVRRDDGVEVDVYPDYNNQLSLDSLVSNVADAEDTTTNPDIDGDASFAKSLKSLGEFVSNPNYVDNGTAVNATVCVWYDQANGNNGNDAEQVTAANQPKIYDSSTGVVTENGKPAVGFDGSSQYFVLSISSLNINNLSVHTVCRTDTIFNNQMQFTLGTDTNARFWHYQRQQTARFYYGSSTPFINYGSMDTNVHLYSFIAGSTSGAARMFKDGTEASSSLTLQSGTPLTSQQRLGAYHTNTIWWSGTIQSFIVYSADNTNNRSGIETNINDYYNIY